MSKVFSVYERTDTSPQKNSESVFSCLDRSARPEIRHIRDVIESWLKGYPVPEVNELVKRMRSTEFDSAYFELLVYTFFVQSGMYVTIHPSVVGSTKRPDFLVRDGDKEFIVEAVNVGDISDEERGRLNVIARLYDAIDELVSPGFFLHLKELYVVPKSQPNMQKVRKFVEGENELISRMDATEIQEYENVYEDERVRIVLGAIAMSEAKANAKPKRSIGMYPTVFAWSKGDQLIKKAIESKATKYGDSPLPYVIAVNCVTEMGIDGDDIINALYGTEVQHCYDGKIVSVTRKANGVFHNATNPINRQVSAVLIASVNPWNLSDARYELYMNPWATFRFESEILSIRVANVIGDELRYRGETNLLSTLGLPEGWPR